MTYAIKILKIREPFWGAWSVYKWPIKSPGIGIDSKIVNSAIEENHLIYLYIGKDVNLYVVSPCRVKEWAAVYDSYKKVRGGITLMVYPKENLKTFLCPPDTTDGSTSSRS